MAGMIQYVIFNMKEEADAFCKTVDTALGYPRLVPLSPESTDTDENFKTYSTFATPIKKYNAEKYAYPVTEAIQHLIPAQKEIKFDLENWYCDAII
ncbi:hypothetical protein HUW51_12645 [Adhaeribacter swui]|uniref:Uncharacterized protein n=1 Tax=Adhaeribacter swui TaxID=2086471 RepID=A0A7G7G8P4_9BACT|nr:hypothetical protein [Adhaeribacter swui]QNF33528.1 hypothetical protein HUW51_12645 [Adhaeribacter swui]